MIAFKIAVAVMTFTASLPFFLRVRINTYYYVTKFKDKLGIGLACSYVKVTVGLYMFLSGKFKLRSYNGSSRHSQKW